MGLAKELKQLDLFVKEMKQKLIEVEWKHPHNIETYNFKELKLHLVDEFCEVFMLDSNQRKIIFNVVNDSAPEILDNMRLDNRELKDLANMCFAVALLYKKKNHKQYFCK